MVGIGGGKIRFRDFVGLLAAVAAWLFLFSSTHTAFAQVTPDIDFPFDLSNPSLNETLPSRLNEISGLAVVDDTTLVAVQDEKGYLYFLDSRTGKLRTRTRFGASGDYEGIALAGEVLFALRSDGDLFRITGWNTDDPKTRKIETELSSRFDTEGLAYDEENNRLLIACKEYPGKRLSGYRAVYAYSLDDEELIRRPVYAVNYDGKKRDEFPGRLSKFEKDRGDRRNFKPSALAIQPDSQRIFILSSVWKVVTILAQDGTLVDVVELPSKSMRQPEGIAFDNSGNLYISSEANGKKPRLFRFDRIN